MGVGSSRSRIVIARCGAGTRLPREVSLSWFRQFDPLRDLGRRADLVHGTGGCRRRQLRRGLAKDRRLADRPTGRRAILRPVSRRSGSPRPFPVHRETGSLSDRRRPAATARSRGLWSFADARFFSGWQDALRAASEAGHARRYYALDLAGGKPRPVMAEGTPAAASRRMAGRLLREPSRATRSPSIPWPEERRHRCRF